MNGTTQTAGISEHCPPPKLPAPPDRKRGVFAAILLAAAGAGAVLFLFNPSRHGFYPICYFHAATGLNCPGCGGLRAVHALLHGHIVEAARLNALLVLCLPLLAGWGARGVARSLRGQPSTLVIRPVWLWTFLAAAVIFTVARNLPAFAWLAP